MLCFVLNTIFKVWKFYIAEGGRVEYEWDGAYIHAYKWEDTYQNWRLDLFARRVILFQCFCNNFDPVNRIQTKFGMNILLDPRNNHAEEFFIFTGNTDDWTWESSLFWVKYVFQIWQCALSHWKDNDE